MIKDNKTEKVSVNMNISTLSYIDLLVDNGYYSNRSDFINHAVRESLSSQSKIVDRIIESNIVKEENPGAVPSNTWFIGVCTFSKEYLEKALKQGIKINIRGYGMFFISKECSDQLVIDSIESISIRGKVVCSDTIKKHFNL